MLMHLLVGRGVGGISSIVSGDLVAGMALGS